MIALARAALRAVRFILILLAAAATTLEEALTRHTTRHKRLYAEAQRAGAARLHRDHAARCLESISPSTTYQEADIALRDARTSLVQAGRGDGDTRILGDIMVIRHSIRHEAGLLPGNTVPPALAGRTRGLANRLRGWAADHTDATGTPSLLRAA